MADNIKVRDADGGTPRVATDDLGGGVHVQRTKTTFGVDGTATDVTAATPLPTADIGTAAAVDAVVTAVQALRAQVGAPLTNAELRANDVPVTGPLTNTQLRATAVPVSGPLTNAQFATIPDGVTPTGVADTRRVSSQLFHSGSNGMLPPRTAGSASDADDGRYFPPAGNMAYDAASAVWRRLRVAKAAAAGLSPLETLAVTPGSYDTASQQIVPSFNALSIADSDTGYRLPPAANMLYRPDTGTWGRARGADAAGGGLGPSLVAASALHNFDATAVAQAPQRTARSLSDAETGVNFPGAGNMQWNGTTWERDRAGESWVSWLANADRSALTTLPSVLNHGRRSRILIVLAVASVGSGTIQLHLRQTGVSASIAALNLTQAIAGSGAAHYVLAVGAGDVGTTTSGASYAKDAAKHAAVAVPMPVPRQLTGYVSHLDGATPWNYSVSYSLLP